MDRAHDFNVLQDPVRRQAALRHDTNTALVAAGSLAASGAAAGAAAAAFAMTGLAELGLVGHVIMGAGEAGVSNLASQSVGVGAYAASGGTVGQRTIDVGEVATNSLFGAAGPVVLKGAAFLFTRARGFVRAPFVVDSPVRPVGGPEVVTTNLDLPPQQVGSPYFVRVNPTTGRGPMAIDTATFTSGTKTLNGGTRNARQFWSQWSDAFPETLSDANVARVRMGQSPVVDDTWIREFPEHADYSGETLIHHHLDYGADAIPLPGSVHSQQPGWGIWHPSHAGQ